MTDSLDGTHDPALRSWLESANDPASDFPIQNLPYGVFRRRGGVGATRIGVAAGDQVLDLSAAADAGLLDGVPTALLGACRETSLNGLMSLGPLSWGTLRRSLSALLAHGSPAASRTAPLLVPMSEVDLAVPAEIGDYTDFYASVQHATNVGSMFRPDSPLLPNYKHVPIGYHGRASSIVPSGTPVRRPLGQTENEQGGSPTFGPSRALDYEMEVGFFVGPGNRLGEPIPIARAADHIFGYCLVNDWSARDIQRWEYQPLGPFLAKNFATTVSPWVVTAEALRPFRAPAFKRPAGDPEPLPYLDDAEDRSRGLLHLTLEVSLSTERMRGANVSPERLTSTSFEVLYWTPAQLLAHHASNGCNLRPGDLLASGTVSGAARGSRGCLLELTWRGAEPLTLSNGETRTFLQDGDEVIMRGACERSGARRIGFGECRGVVVAAPTVSR